MASRKNKIVEVQEESIPVIAKPAISVLPSQKEVPIPKNTVAWKLGDIVGFVNKSGLQTMIDNNPGLEYDETLTTIPRPIRFKMPFGKNDGGCKNC